MFIKWARDNDISGRKLDELRDENLWVWNVLDRVAANYDIILDAFRHFEDVADHIVRKWVVGFGVFKISVINI